MAKQVIWSKRAKDDRRAILQYWLLRNKSNVYPKRLNAQIRNAVKFLSENRFGRRSTDYTDVFVKIVKDYKILFEEDEATIYILTVWDSRQDPEKLDGLMQGNK